MRGVSEQVDFTFSMSTLARYFSIDDIVPVAWGVSAKAGADTHTVANARRQAADRVCVRREGVAAHIQAGPDPPGVLLYAHGKTYSMTVCRMRYGNR